MPKVGISVIIISWNTRDITDKCLGYIKEAIDYVKGRADVEVIVSEHASKDGSAEMIAKKHPWVKLVPAGKDLGYGKGNNFGFKHTNPKYNYLLLLNNDAYVRKATIVDALAYFERHPECDVLGCRLVYKDGRFQPSGGYLPTPLSVWTWIWGFDLLPVIGNYLKQVHPKNPNFFKNDREVGWVMGAFVFMKRRVFEKTKGFDENFFMYMEEVEWCRRVWDAGFRICYTPKFTITHIGKASAFNDPQELAKIFNFEIMGLVYYLRKHYPGQIPSLMPIIRIGVLARYLAFSILGNDIRKQGYLKAYKGLKTVDNE